MARVSQWRRTINDLVSWRQDQGLAATIYIVREIGPTGFLLKEENERKPSKVFIGDPHSCTCSEFRKDHDLCKHICWLLLKKFKVLREDPISWQLGLVEREINSLLKSEETRRIQRNRPETARALPTNSAAQTSDGRPALEQREISADDTCPICMEELLAKKEPVTYCKYSCANSIHIKCMKIWAEHQTKGGEQTIKCPFCREDFGPADYLREEYRNTAASGLHANRSSGHPGTLCRSCSQSPIRGKCYRCTTCNEYQLCQKCFNTSIHLDHSFEFRSAPAKRWRPAQRIMTNGAALPSALADSLMSRDIGDGDYDLLLQLDSNNSAELSQIPESAIQKLPLERVRNGSRLLLPGEQCCICLRAYQLSEFVRRLPCQHKFHKDCIDNWLLHQHSSCPLDGRPVWNPHDTDQADQRSQGARGDRRQRRGRVAECDNQQRLQRNQPPSLTLEIPGIGILRNEVRSAPAVAAPADPSVILSTRSLLNNNRATSATMASGRPASNPQDPSEEAASAGLNLSQLILSSQQTSHLSGTRSSSNSRSQIGNNLSQLPESVRRNAEAVTLSDSESENQRRRRRNLSLASRSRLVGGSASDISSSPSISTTQPAESGQLFLGSADGGTVVTSTGRVSSLIKRRTPVKDASMSGNPNSLYVGRFGTPDGRQTSKLNLNKKSIQKKTRDTTLPHVPNLSGLELNGTRW